MKVKYKGIDETGSYITGKEYPVISVIFGGSENKIKFRLIPEDYIYSCLEKSDEFEIVDESLNLGWMLDILDSSYAELTPNAWKYDDFWPNLYDDFQKEKDIYREEIKKMFPEEKELHERLNDM